MFDDGVPPWGGGRGEESPGRWTSTGFPCPLSLVGLGCGTPVPGGGGEAGLPALWISTGPPGPLLPVGLGSGMPVPGGGGNEEGSPG